MSKFQRAERRRVKIKIGVTAPSGGGKTYSALLIAKGLATRPDGTMGKIALVDTENESASLYAGNAGIPEFDTLPITAPFHTRKYIEAINDAVREGYEVLVIDSGSHQWNGTGGIMDRMDKEKLAKPSINSYTLWAKYTPEHEEFKAAIVQSQIHIIITLRSKQEYALEKDEKTGKQTPRKVGLAPVQRDQFEYELSCVFDLSMEHFATVSKDRTGLFDGQCFIPTENTGRALLEWLATGKEPLPPPPAAKPPVSPNQPGHVPPKASSSSTADRRPSEAQLKRLFAIKNASHVSDDDLKQYIGVKYGLVSTKDLTMKQYDEVCNEMGSGGLAKYLNELAQASHDPESDAAMEGQPTVLPPEEPGAHG